MLVVMKRYDQAFQHLSSCSLSGSVENVASAPFGLFLSQYLKVFHRLFHRLVENLYKLKVVL
ncbi:MAG: hypothetical protein DMF68_08975 [Acidobacteria bacterium]|nr:MAG: hypothetical protein DMF68_08975 [Acidobacteriota bacterium]